MIPSGTVYDRLQRAFRPTQRGVVGLTEQLLGACVGGDVEFERVGDRCVYRWTEGGDTQEAPVPFSPAAFRTILACVATLCNERSPGSVSPYGGEGELVVGAAGVFVKFINTTYAQKLAVKSDPGRNTVPQPLPANEDAAVAEFAGLVSRMNATLDRIDASLAGLRTWAEEGKPLPFIDEAQDFVVGPPMDEAELQAIERAYEVRLPPEYRGFLARFGDTSVGPCHFRRVKEGLSKRSKNRFPMEKPLLGTLSPEHQRLPKELQWDDYGRLLKRWEPISKEDGVLAISDYGCAIYGVLILNGPFCGKVWIHQGDTAYYGPFGGSEPLHDESRPPEWQATEHPREYSFLEWYESWLNARLQMVGLLPW